MVVLPFANIEMAQGPRYSEVEAFVEETANSPMSPLPVGIAIDESLRSQLTAAAETCSTTELKRLLALIPIDSPATAAFVRDFEFRIRI